MANELLRLTMLDWVILSLIAAVSIQGARSGLVNFLLIGRARSLLAVTLAPTALGWALLEFGGPRKLATNLAIPVSWVSSIGAVASIIGIYFVLGIVGHLLSMFSMKSAIGAGTNRILGSCAGAFVGVWLSIACLVGPSLAVQDYVKMDRQPQALHASVLVPWVNRNLRPRVEGIVAILSRR